MRREDPSNEHHRERQSEFSDRHSILAWRVADEDSTLSSGFDVDVNGPTARATHHTQERVGKHLVSHGGTVHDEHFAVCSVVGYF